MLFLANMVSKMKHATRLGSRIAEVHNGSSLFTGDAGQGESNIRRWIIENDWLEAIVALPLNMFYNTGIATYVWVLSNRKAEHRRGKVQLIDASQRFQPLRKSLGKKNCEFSDEDIDHICKLYVAFADTSESRVLPNEALGYRKLTVERPLRLRVSLDESKLQHLRTASEGAGDRDLFDAVVTVARAIGDGPHNDAAAVFGKVEMALSRVGAKLTAKHRKLLIDRVGIRDKSGGALIRRVHKTGAIADPMRGLFTARVDGKDRVVEYEPDVDLRDNENVPMLEPGGIDAYFAREVTPFAPDAWIDASKTLLGYEVPFAKYFFKFEPLRSVEEIADEILQIERDAQGLLADIVAGVPRR
jgi:type I restriction enzyme M protein